MKKFISGAIALVMLLMCAIGGGAFAEARKLSVVTTIFPIYDWVRQIAGDSDDVEITLLLDSGVDLHSYQPTTQDILKVASCDVFVYVGGESDGWVEDALAQSMNPDMAVVNLVEAIGEDIKTEEIVEGMEHEHDEHDEDEHDEDEHDEDEHEHEHDDEVDEHVWLSLRNARKLVKVLADALAGADPANADAYAANAAAYGDSLDALDAAYADAVGAADYDTVLFGDRFPFRYLADDYGLSYYAAFAGCSAETEASFETIAFLSDKVDALRLPAVLTIEGTDHRIAETIVNNTASGSAAILTMDSMQGTTAADAAAGATYLDIMAQNLGVLKQALAK